jgi:peptide/nickel transport system substrate-binding protein
MPALGSLDRVRLGRRALVAGGLGAAGALLAACGPAAAPTAPSAAGPPGAPTTAAGPVASPPAATAPPAAIKRSGTLRTTFGTGLQTLNPIISTSGGDFYNLLYDPLVRYRLVDPAARSYEVLPALATDWEWGKADKEIVFRLRKGVKFHDGSDWNAEVAKWNFDLMMTHPKSFAKPYVEAIQTVEVVDPMQIRLVLKAPSAPLLANLSDTTGIVYFISKAQHDKLGEDGFGANPSGTGPMRFDAWVKESKVAIKRFDGYWDMGADGKPLPYLDGVEYRLIPEAATAMVELRTGNLDWYLIDAKDVAAVKSNPDLVFTSVPLSGSIFVTIGLNQAHGVFGKSLKLRQAALHAFNREALMKTFAFGQGTLTPYPFWVEGMIGYDPGLPRYDYDPEKAKTLIAEAGYASGVDITLYVIQRPLEQQVAQVLQQMWQDVGIRAKFEILERTAFINKMKEGTGFDAAFWRPPFSVDPDQIGRQILTGAGGNWNNNPEVDRLMADGRSTLDPAKRQEVYKRVQVQLYNDACLACSYYLPDLVAYRRTLKGVEYDAKQPRFHAIWMDK